MAVTYFYVKTISGPNGGGNIPWTINQSAAGQTNANVSDVHTFSSNIANQAWLTFTRAAGGRVNLPQFGAASQTLATYGSNFLIQGPNALPNFGQGGFTAGTTNAGPFTGSNNYELRDMVTWTKGKHTLYLGGEFALDKTMFFADLLNFGTISFATSAPTSTGNVFGDWVTGQASSFEQDTPYKTLISYWHYAAFVQDSYRITPRFTVNLGLRWDIDTSPVESLNRTASFSPGQQSTVTPIAPKGLLFVGDSGVALAASSAISFTISRRVSASHGTRLGTARHRFAQPRASSMAPPAATNGTSRATLRHSPFARPSVPSHPSPISTPTPGDFPASTPGGGIFIFPYVLASRARNSSPRPLLRASQRTRTISSASTSSTCLCSNSYLPKNKHDCGLRKYALA